MSPLHLWTPFFYIALIYIYIAAALSDPNSDFCRLPSAGLHGLFGLHFIALWSEICPQEEDSIDRGTALGQVHSLKNNVLALVVV